MPVPSVHAHILPRGRGAAMNKQDAVQKMLREANIVKTFNQGGATVHIADNFCAKTPEDIERVLEQYYATGWSIARLMAERGELA